MNEQAKLKEARYFYSRMVTEFNDREAFTHNLSAFLSSSRSALQYALEEARNKRGGQEWYDKKITHSHLLSFFKDKRDINVHTKPVSPVQHSSVSVNAIIHISTSVSVTHRDAKGNILYQSPVEESEHKRIAEAPIAPARTESQYRFSDWKGTEDILTLSQMYLGEVENIVKSGIQEGFLAE